MKKIIAIIFICFSVTQSSAQLGIKLKSYLSVQYNKTIADETIGNNPWSVGLGFQSFVINRSKFVPTVEFTADVYLQNDKVFRTNPDGTPIPDVRSMVNIFFGCGYKPIKSVYVLLTAGPSFTSGQTLFGIKPALGFYFPHSKKWTAKISYINIFNRNEKTKKDFSSVSLSAGFKLF